MDVAHSAQKVFEDIVLEIANESFKKNNSNNLCLSGGCAMNSVANGKIKLFTPYKKIYIPPAPGDSGGAIGSASIVLNNNNLVSFDDNPYLGPKYSNEYIQEILEKNKEELKIQNINKIIFSSKNEMLKKIALMISENNVVGFFNDRMEWGPRALGNRSILADPRKKNMKEILN